MTPLAVARGAGARAVLATVTVGALSLTGCSNSKAGAGAGPSTSPATRWWSNSVVSAGSTIAASDPTSAAAKLTSSRDEYCQMLKQTLAVGKSLLPSAQAKDPRLLPTTEAFVSEIEAVAPAQVVPSWKVLGPVILQLVRSAGSLPTSQPGDTSGNLKAAETINADAKANCKLDLSSVVTGS